VAGCGLFGPFKGTDGPGLAPDPSLEFEDDRYRRLDRVTRLGLRGAEAALEDGGIPPGDPVRGKCGIFLGNAYGTYPANLAHQRLILEEGGRSASPAIFTTTLPNVPSGWISIAGKLQGPLMTFAGGLTASAEAMAAAFLHLQSSRTDWLLAGGAHAHDEEVHRALGGAGRSQKPTPNEGAAFLLLACDGVESPRATFTGAGWARASGVPDPLEAALSKAGAQTTDAVLAAGDATRDGETRERLNVLGFHPVDPLSARYGDLGEAAPAVASVLAVGWVRGEWSPSEGPSPVDSVLVAGLDPCARRAFALRFTKTS
jgi:hypothetical protein